MRWTCGITTVAERVCGGMLAKTQESLKNAGFTIDRLFIDGHADVEDTATIREPKISIVGNYLLGMLELYIREPHADLYAMFQDDIIAVKNLRQYIEQHEFPHKGYLNLITFPENTILSGGKQGWFASNQLGRGAIGLIFNQEGLLTLLGSPVTLDKPRLIINHAHRVYPHKNLDGMIVTAMKRAGWKEYVHNPSLLQHTGGGQTTLDNHIGNDRWPGADSFPGEEFDALSLLGVE
jgi:hypothetical protein